MMQINIVGNCEVVSHSWIESAVQAVESVVGSQAGEVSIVFVDSEYMAYLNNAYRDKQGATNVLAFPLTNETQTVEVEGDIFICEPKACSSEKQIFERCEQEIVFLVIHGFLHILGYDHHEDADFKEMDAAERKVMESLSLF